MLRSFILLLFLLLTSHSLSATEIIDLIKRGETDEARRKIAELSTAVRRDGTLLYYQALLEPDGQKSLQFLQAAFKAGISPRFLEEDIYLMVQYYLAEGNFEKVASTSEAYLQQWEAGQYRSEVLRLAALAFQKINQPEKSQKYLKRLIRENPDAQPGFAGQLDEAVGLYRNENYIKAQNICRKLRNVKYDGVVSPALYMLSLYSIEQKRIDDAILYYNLLKEGYPYAIGLDDLVDRFSRFEKRADDQRAERMTGTVYSVQVGVFSVKDNAKKLAGRLKQYGEPTEISDRVISGKKYYVVYVGRFLSSEEAMVFKARLELSENEAFQVVAR